MLLPVLPGISTDRHLGDKQFFGCLCGSALCPVRTVTETGEEPSGEKSARLLYLVNNAILTFNCYYAELNSVCYIRSGLPEVVCFFSFSVPYCALSLVNLIGKVFKSALILSSRYLT